MAQAAKQLICPACGQVMATAVARTFTGLQITTSGGFLLTPTSDDLELRISQQRLADSSAADQPAAQQRLSYVLSHAGDRFYDLTCPQGHHTVRTAPELTRAIRHAAGDQVSLAG